MLLDSLWEGIESKTGEIRKSAGKDVPGGFQVFQDNSKIKLALSGIINSSSSYKCHSKVRLNGRSAVGAKRTRTFQHTFCAGLAGHAMGTWRQNLALRPLHTYDTQAVIVFGCQHIKSFMGCC